MSQVDEEFADEFNLPIPQPAYAPPQEFDVEGTTTTEQHWSCQDTTEEAAPVAADSRGINESVKQFITHLYRNIVDHKVHELHGLYENTFNKLTERWYTQTTWPAPESVASLLNNGTKSTSWCAK